MTRSLSRRRFLTIAACAGLAGSSSGYAATERLTWQGIALGADVSITLVGPESITRPALARARLEIEAYEQRFSLFRPDSELVRLNADGMLRDLDPRWQSLLAACDRLHKITGGVFDPTIQPLWQAHARGTDIAEARARVGWERIALPGPGLRGIRLDKGQALSFNGIAQGAATDAVRDVLRMAGMTQVLIDIGESHCIGGPWYVALADPEAGQFAQVTLEDRAVAVSSPGALRISEGTTHILHPHAAAPPIWSSTAVIARDAALADGLSTAACFLTPEDLRASIAALPEVETVMVLDPQGKTRSLFAR